ncbi:hybrid sensor histidine kinase/response regulator [Caldimonas tepidiphila]|uniref:hybrid sensor histidine kinase/response regulator n=1 Tax=Caldimonas tepidiphila TaxID=2315841 RepID=UPI0014762415|nr:ATP-binding protein [Caldimonas tepidiphila]
MPSRLRHPGGAVPSLRYRLFWLAAAALLPFALVAALAIAEIAAERRAETRLTAMELSRILIHSVDAELRRTIAVLEVLAQSPELERGELQAFYERCRRLAQRQPHWRSVSLTDAGMHRVFNTGFPFPPPPIDIVDPPSFQRTVATGAPVVGGVRTFRGRWAFTVRVPVLRDGKVRYVLSVPVDPAAIHAVLVRQGIAEDWTVAVYDESGLRVARSRAHEESVGARATPSLQRLMQGATPEGSGIATTVEGEAVHTGFSRRSEFGWSVVVGLPDSRVRAVLRRQTLLHAGGLLVSCLLCISLAFLASRRVTGPMASLREAARALGRREPLPEVRSGVREIDEVAAALAAALKELQSSEAQREALLKATEAALARAEAAGRAKDEFLAVLGHELRNPLAPIVTSLHVMERKGDTATAPQRALIRRQVAQMTRLVDDLLDVSRITSGRVELKRAPLDLNAVVERAVEAAAPAPGAAAPRLSVRLADVPARVSGDEVRLVQVVSNLLVNAFKFTPPDGRVEVEVRAGGERVEVRVTDSGRGIPKEFLPRVFDLFTQASREGERTSEGLGLGLAIVRSLVELHGGQVGVHSEGPGRGSCFTVTLPAASEPAAVPAAPHPAAAVRGEGRILVVDDNVDAADSLATWLGMHGYEVRTEHHPEAALQALDAFVPDVAILDIGLPGMDGYELARRLRAHPAGVGAALLALTGYGQASDRQQALDAGFDLHLAKPVDAERLLSVLASLRAGGG